MLRLLNSRYKTIVVWSIFASVLLPLMTLLSVSLDIHKQIWSALPVSFALYTSPAKPTQASLDVTNTSSLSLTDMAFEIRCPQEITSVTITHMESVQKFMQTYKGEIERKLRPGETVLITLAALEPIAICDVILFAHNAQPASFQEFQDNERVERIIFWSFAVIPLVFAIGSLISYCIELKIENRKLRSVRSDKP